MGTQKDATKQLSDAKRYGDFGFLPVPDAVMPLLRLAELPITIDARVVNPSEVRLAALRAPDTSKLLRAPKLLILEG